MKRPAYTLIELLVVIAIIAVLIGLLLAAVQKVREAAARLKCQNNLRQVGLAAHNYHESHLQFPAGSTPIPSNASVQLALLPYLEEAAKFQQFDLSRNVYTAPTNHAGRTQQVPIYLCPSDPSTGQYVDLFPLPGVTPGVSGRSNYFGNAGAHGWVRESQASIVRPTHLAGVFGLNTRVRLLDLTDGTSNTVLFAEIKRGAAPNNNELDVTRVPTAQWNNSSLNPATNPNNLAPPSACGSPTSTLNLTGLQYYRGDPFTCLYTHTFPPNYRGRDCINFGGDQFHLAARSHHPGGANVALADGSVRFIGDGIRLETWKALGTRCGGEVIDPF